MRTNVDPRELVEQILKRSICEVQVGAALADDWGVFSWGWNSAGRTGFGLHAEIHCLERANRKRLEGATLYVAGRRMKSGNPVCSRPCPSCWKVVAPLVGRVIWRDVGGKWEEVRL